MSIKIGFYINVSENGQQTPGMNIYPQNLQVLSDLISNELSCLTSVRSFTEKIKFSDVDALSYNINLLEIEESSVKNKEMLNDLFKPYKIENTNIFEFTQDDFIMEKLSLLDEIDVMRLIKYKHTDYGNAYVKLSTQTESLKISNNKVFMYSFSNWFEQIQLRKGELILILKQWEDFLFCYENNKIPCLKFNKT